MRKADIDAGTSTAGVPNQASFSGVSCFAGGRCVLAGFTADCNRKYCSTHDVFETVRGSRVTHSYVPKHEVESGNAALTGYSLRAADVVPRAA